MRAYGEKHPFYRRELSIREIANARLNVTLYRINNNGRHLAICSQNGRKPIHGVTELVVNDEDYKVPLYKQAMYMQVGRKINTKRTKILSIHEINEDNNYKYSIYICR